MWTSLGTCMKGVGWTGTCLVLILAVCTTGIHSQESGAYVNLTLHVEDVPWDSEYTNISSQAFSLLATNLTKQIYCAYNETLHVERIFILDITQEPDINGITVTASVQLNSTDIKFIREQTSISIRNETQLGDYQLNWYSFTVTRFNTTSTTDTRPVPVSHHVQSATDTSSLTSTSVSKVMMTSSPVHSVGTSSMSHVIMTSETEMTSHSIGATPSMSSHTEMSTSTSSQTPSPVATSSVSQSTQTQGISLPAIQSQSTSLPAKESLSTSPPATQSPSTSLPAVQPVTSIHSSLPSVQSSTFLAAGPSSSAAIPQMTSSIKDRVVTSTDMSISSDQVKTSMVYAHVSSSSVLEPSTTMPQIYTSSEVANVHPGTPSAITSSTMPGHVQIDSSSSLLQASKTSSLTSHWTVTSSGTVAMATIVVSSEMLSSTETLPKVSSSVYTGIYSSSSEPPVVVPPSQGTSQSVSSSHMTSESTSPAVSVQPSQTLSVNLQTSSMDAMSSSHKEVIVIPSASESIRVSSSMLAIESSLEGKSSMAAVTKTFTQESSSPVVSSMYASSSIAIPQTSESSTHIMATDSEMQSSWRSDTMSSSSEGIVIVPPVTQAQMSTTPLMDTSSYGLPPDSSMIAHMSSTMAYPTPSSTMAYSSSSSTLANPPSSLTMIYSTSSSTVAYPRSSSTMAYQTSSSKMAYPPSSSTMAYSTSSPTVAYPTFSSTMAYPRSSSTMAYPTSSSTMAYPRSSSTMIYSSSSTMAYPTSSSTMVYSSSSLTMAYPTSTIETSTAVILPPFQSESRQTEMTSSKMASLESSSSHINVPLPSKDVTSSMEPTQSMSVPLEKASASVSLSSVMIEESSSVILTPDSSSPVMEAVKSSSIAYASSILPSSSDLSSSSSTLVVVVPPLPSSETYSSLGEASSALPGSVLMSSTSVTSIESSVTSVPRTSSSVSEPVPVQPTSSISELMSVETSSSNVGVVTPSGVPTITRTLSVSGESSALMSSYSMTSGSSSVLMESSSYPGQMESSSITSSELQSSSSIASSSVVSVPPTTVPSLPESTTDVPVSSSSLLVTGIASTSLESSSVSFVTSTQVLMTSSSTPGLTSVVQSTPISSATPVSTSIVAQESTSIVAQESTTMIETSSIVPSSTEIMTSSAVLTSPTTPPTTEAPIVDVSGKFSITDGKNFTDELTNTSTPEYQNLKGVVMYRLEELYKNSSLKESFIRISAIIFSQGSIVVDYTAEFHQNEHVTADNITEAFKAGLKDGQFLGNYTIDGATVEHEVTPRTTTPITTTPTTTPPKATSTDESFPNWAIAVIVCGSILLLFLVFMLCVLCSRRHTRQKYRMPEDPDDIGYRRSWADSNEFAYDNKLAISDNTENGGSQPVRYDLADTLPREQVRNGRPRGEQAGFTNNAVVFFHDNIMTLYNEDQDAWETRL